MIKTMLKLKVFHQWFLIILSGIVLAISLRVFVFAVFTIPTPSMRPTIEGGDRVVVNKLIPGPRIISNFFSLKDGEEPNYVRLLGWRKIKHNDVLIFNYPYSKKHLTIDRSVFYAKRCVATPGDTFYIENGRYKVKGISDTLGHYPAQKKLSEMPVEKIKKGVYRCFPKKSQYNWNVKDFGSIYIPAKGDTLAINTKNQALYKNLITYETNKNITVSDSLVLLGDSIINKYVFHKNYYFMAGDYVFDSKDSRYWGLLPEDHIVGKVSFIYKSVNPKNGKYRWGRFFKKVE